MWYYIEAVYYYLRFQAVSFYRYAFCKEKEIIPFDAREKIYDRDPEVLNSIINYYRYDKFGKKLY